MKVTGYPLHSHVSPSLPGPCVTVCHHISTALYRRLSRGLKQPRRQIYHPPASSTEIKNEWMYTFTPSIRLHGVEPDDFYLQYAYEGSRVSSVPIATCYCVDSLGLEPGLKKIHLLPTSLDTRGDHPDSCKMGNGFLTRR